VSENNIVKRVCKELGVTQKELAEVIGVSEGTVNRWASKPEEITVQANNTFNLILENIELKQKIVKYEDFFKLLSELQDRNT
jgi:transcriptional regulator with XRE-family HTH domain